VATYAGHQWTDSGPSQTASLRRADNIEAATATGANQQQVSGQRLSAKPLSINPFMCSQTYSCILAVCVHCICVLPRSGVINNNNNSLVIVRAAYSLKLFPRDLKASNFVHMLNTHFKPAIVIFLFFWYFHKNA